MTTIYVEDERKTLRDHRTVILSGEVEDCCAEEFIEDMEIMSYDSDEPINIIILSGGGSVDAGLACIREIQKIQEKGIHVVGEVHGHAQSMAFLILQTCSERIMGKYCLIMAHGVTSYTHGDLRNLEAEREILTFWRREFGALIANRCNNDSYNSAYWEKVLEDSTPMYFTSDKAFALGLVDLVE